MNILALAIIAMLGSSEAHVKPVTAYGNHTYDFSSSDPAHAHESANIFARQVGQQLKATYPSRLTASDVHVFVFTYNGTKMYRFVWSYRISPLTRSASNDYYFDRRGTFLCGKDADVLKRNVIAEIQRSHKLEQLVHALPATVPGTREVWSKEVLEGSAADGYCYLKEYFGTSPKK